MRYYLKAGIIVLMAVLLSETACFGQGIDYTNEQIANAIYKAEGGAKTSHPYGILAHYKHTTPRQACINTIHNQRIRHAKHNCGKDFLTCLRNRYCPIGAENDPTNLNKNWVNNVRYFLEKNKNKSTTKTQKGS